MVIAQTRSFRIGLAAPGLVGPASRSAVDMENVDLDRARQATRVTAGYTFGDRHAELGVIVLPDGHRLAAARLPEGHWRKLEQWFAGRITEALPDQLGAVETVVVWKKELIVRRTQELAGAVDRRGNEGTIAGLLEPANDHLRPALSLLWARDSLSRWAAVTAMTYFLVAKAPQFSGFSSGTV